MPEPSPPDTHKITGPATGGAAPRRREHTMGDPLDDRDDSIEGRAANGENGGGEFEPELFPTGSIDGDAKTIKTLIRAGMPVKTTASLMSAEVPTRGGLLDPERNGHLLVAFEVAKYEPIVEREGEPGAKKVVGWKIRQHLRPVYVETIDGGAGEIEASFAALLDGDPKGAAALVDRLQGRVAEVLQTA